MVVSTVNIGNIMEVKRMTIDEAILVYTQRAENHEYVLHSGEFIGGDGEHMKQDIKRCVSENRQLVEWLTELKHYREVFNKSENGKPTIEWLY